MRTTGFALRNVFRTSLARWLLIIATGSAATSCSGTLSTIADKVANVLPGQTSSPSAPKPAKTSAELLHGGDAARETGDLNTAATNYAAAIAVDPKSVEAELRLGAVDLARKDENGAVAAFQAAQKLDPDYQSLRNNYGLMQLANGDLQGALATFSTLVAAPQANDRYRLNRALVELALGQTDAALADAPGMDEAGLRQTLAIYQPPAQDKTDATADNETPASANSDGDKSPLPNVHLAVDPPAGSPAAVDTTTASIKPVAGLPPTASP